MKEFAQAIGDFFWTVFVFFGYMILWIFATILLIAFIFVMLGLPTDPMPEYLPIVSIFLSILLSSYFSKKAYEKRMSTRDNDSDNLEEISPPKLKPSDFEILQVKSLMGQLQESVEIVNTTTSPKTFWGRLNFSLDVLLELQKYEHLNLFYNSTPTADYNKILNNLEATVNDFIDRVIIAQSDKNEMLETQYEQDKRMEKCLSNLWNSFYESNDYWRGNNMFPHYDGKLYVDKNFERVEDMLNDVQQKVIRNSVSKKTLKSPPAKTQVKKGSTSAKPKMTPQEKELFLVQHVTTDDMREVPNLPFEVNCDVKKYIREGVHPFAYMNVVGENIDFVKSELNKINSYIERDSIKYKKIPKNARIPIQEIVFNSSDLHAYTKFICTPKTPTGKFAKYPFKIAFFTDMNRFNNERYSTHGEIVYNQAGTIASANIYCWRPSGGFFIYYKTIDGKLVLSGAEKAGI